MSEPTKKGIIIALGILILLCGVGYQEQQAATAAARKAATAAQKEQALKTFREHFQVFNKTFIKSHMNRPESWDSPERTAESIHDLSDYCAAAQDLQSSLVDINTQAGTVLAKPVNDMFDARIRWCSSEIVTYQFLATRARWENGKIIPDDATADQFDVLMAKLNSDLDAYVTADEALTKWMASAPSGS